MHTRQYPRTLHEAFPYGPSYGAAIERPAPRRRIWPALLALVALLVLSAWSKA